MTALRAAAAAEVDRLRREARVVRVRLYFSRFENVGVK